MIYYFLYLSTIVFTIMIIYSRYTCKTEECGQTSVTITNNALTGFLLKELLNTQTVFQKITHIENSVRLNILNAFEKDKMEYIKLGQELREQSTHGTKIILTTYTVFKGYNGTMLLRNFNEYFNVVLSHMPFETEDKLCGLIFHLILFYVRKHEITDFAIMTPVNVAKEIASIKAIEVATYKLDENAKNEIFDGNNEQNNTRECLTINEINKIRKAKKEAEMKARKIILKKVGEEAAELEGQNWIKNIDKNTMQIIKEIVDISIGIYYKYNVMNVKHDKLSIYETYKYKLDDLYIKYNIKVEEEENASITEMISSFFVNETHTMNNWILLMTIILEYQDPEILFIIAFLILHCENISGLLRKLEMDEGLYYILKNYTRNKAYFSYYDNNLYIINELEKYNKSDNIIYTLYNNPSNNN